MVLFSSKLYVHCPTAAQDLLISGRSLARKVLRRPTLLQRIGRELEQSQWLPPDALQKLQLEALRRVVEVAARHVPFYRERFARTGFDPGQLNDLSDIARLGLVEKADVRRDGARMLSEQAPLLRFASTTSGTTGTPLRGWRDTLSICAEQAFIQRQLRWAGWAPGQRRAWLRGDRIVPLPDWRGPFWRHDRADDCLMVSSFHLAERTAEAYVDALERFEPILIQAYPNSIAFLARQMIERGRRYRGSALRGVVTSSEPLRPEQRLAVERAFGAKVFDWYGSFERVAAIGTCEHGNYHLIADYSHVELVPNAGGDAEIVGTGFYNLTMPLLRYRLVDSVVPADPTYRCPCGRGFRVIERILGREDDQIRTADGRWHVALDLIFADVPGLVEGQWVQDTVDTVYIRAVTSEAFTRAVEARLLAAARERLGNAVNITIQRVASIPRSDSGKFRGIVSHVR